MTQGEKYRSPPVRALLLAVPALLGLAGLLSYGVVLIAKHAWDVELIEGDAGWFVIMAGIYGGMAFLVFGALSVGAWRSEKAKTPQRR